MIQLFDRITGTVTEHAVGKPMHLGTADYVIDGPAILFDGNERWIHDGGDRGFQIRLTAGAYVVATDAAELRIECWPVNGRRFACGLPRAADFVGE